MTTVNAIIEDWVRERPEHWLWLHRRWPRRSIPEDRRSGRSSKMASPEKPVAMSA
jgi:lauroyl/myristoyl acyltransferase